MIGIVIAAHLSLAEEFLKVAKEVVGSFENVCAVSVDIKKDPESIKRELEEAVKSVNDGDGVLIMTDMFGGTPSNISLSLLKEGEVEVITGLNLPMLIKAATSRRDIKLSEFSKSLKEFGKNNIELATDVLSSGV